jgi:sec-independent protein translocase protein TatA
MGFGNLGFGEIFMVLIVVLLLFGAKRIPEIAGSLGKGINSFKKNLGEVEQSVRAELPRDDRPADRLASASRDEVVSSQPAEESRPEPKRLLQ